MAETFVAGDFADKVVEQEFQILRESERIAGKGAVTVGLCLSGGGIRSASFNLGIIQQLDKMDLLKHVDYLSTVSGGGYIGSWLASCRRWGAPLQRYSNGRENHSFRHLRQFSRYLTPESGLFSLDSLTMLGILLRNMLLNQIVLFSCLALILALPLLLKESVFLPHPHPAGHESRVPTVLMLGSAAVFLACCWKASKRLENVGQPGSAGPWQVFLEFVAPITVLAFVVSSVFWNHVQWMMEADDTVKAFVAIIFGGVALRIVWVSGSPWVSGASKLAIGGIAAVLCGLGAVVMAEPLVDFICKGTLTVKEAVVVLPALFIGISGILVMLLIGIMGRQLHDSKREWWSRTGAMLAIVATAWGVTAGIAIYVPDWLRGLVSKSGGLYALLASWAGSAWGAYKLASSFSTKEDKKEDTSASWLMLAGQVAAALFIAAILCALAVLNEAVVAWARPQFTRVMAFFGQTPSAGLQWSQWLVTSIALTLYAIVLALFGTRFDVNEFSLNHFYRNRLVRCYMGAARQHKEMRRRDELTGLDFDDDFAITNLLPKGYPGPFHIVNTSLNLSKPTDLAVQDRKADSFVITPLYCGSPSTGYRLSDGYIYGAGYSIKLGTAVAISGAAASPNMGNLTSPLLAFVMTIFNVRLGWWVPHPNPERGEERQAPVFSLYYLIKELTAATTKDDGFLYLSDGGHFENLGAYELIRRRCRLVIVGNGECDGAFTFGALGNLIRICRLDFNIEIDIDPAQISDRGGTRFGKTHCAVGRIKYKDAPEGTLLYLMSSLTGDEPPDVLQYARVAADFPHETTGDQFFSEEQFESYRKLGEHVAETAFTTAVEDWKQEEAAWDKAGAADDKDRRRLEPLLVALRRVWFSPAKSALKFTNHTTELVRIWERIRASESLSFLDAQFFPSWQELIDSSLRPPRPRGNQWLPKREEELRDAFYLCQSLIQLMENVYVDLDLEREGGHPDHRGWINLFRHWAGSNMLRVTWALSCQTYGARFQSYARREVGLKNYDEIYFEDIDIATCNAVERGEYTALVNERADMKDTRLLALYVKVNHVLDKTTRFRYRAGLLAVSGKDGEWLHWIRIQSQLRSMGLGRAAVDLYQKQLRERTPPLTLRRGEADAEWLKKQSPEVREHVEWLRRVLP